MKEEEVLRKYFGYENFRGIQKEIVNLLCQKEKILAVMATGSGKSICFQVSGILLEGLTIVISPLISLIIDQVKKLKKHQIKAAFLLSDMTILEVKQVYERLEKKELKFLYLAPERLLNQKFISVIKNVKVSQVIVDEAHSISMWGEDFRKSYQDIPSFLKVINRDANLALFTATANDKVIADIQRILMLDRLKILKTSSDRINLYYGVAKPKIKFAYLLKYLNKKQNVKGIIYTLTRKESLELATKLNEYHFPVTYFHGGMEMLEKKRSQQAFMQNEKNIMVATNAFGMGIDLPDIRYVILYTMPLSLADLAQQFGRCSRDGNSGECILLYDDKDIKRCLYFFKDDKAKIKEFKKVLKWCETKECLHNYLVEYFDKKKMPKCLNCSNCLSHKKMKRA